MSAPDSDEPFLRRWSRRKAAVRHEDDERPTPPAASPEATAPAAPPEAIDPAELPDPDTLGKDADFTVFMREGVPAALRRRALRRLWRSDPVFANLDGLNDYDGDFTGTGIAAGDVLRTAWRAGRGYGADDKKDGEEKDGGAPAQKTPDQSTEGEAQVAQGVEELTPPEEGEDGTDNLR